MAEAGLVTPQEAFGRHFDDVYGYVAYRLAPNLHAAQEVTQDVFLAAMEGWDSYRGDGQVLSWLRAIARHKLANYFRQQSQRICPTSLDAQAEALASPAAAMTDRAMLLSQSMRSLPPEYVELLEEKYLEGLSVRQMAQRRTRTEKAVESALSRARELLRNTFLQLAEREEHSHERTEL